MTFIRIALTFDGGPHGMPADGKRPNQTGRILDWLAKPATLDPRLAGAPPVVGAFFVQTHVPGRMAGADGSLGSGASLTPGQLLVKRVAAAGHRVGVLNGSAHDLQPHPDQGAALTANLQRAVDAVAPLLPAGSQPPYVEFVRAPHGLHPPSCDDAYAAVHPAEGKQLFHASWHLQATLRPPGDLVLAFPVTAQAGRLRDQVREAALALARAMKPGVAPPPPRLLVVRLHDIAPGTAVFLPQLVGSLLDGGKLSKGRTIEVRLCASAAEVDECLRATPRVSEHVRLDQLRKDQTYAKDPRMAENYGTFAETLVTWALVEHEGWANHLYLDTKSLLTVGVGQRVMDKPGEGVVALDEVPLSLADGTLATPEQKKNAAETLKKNRDKIGSGELARLREARRLAPYDVPESYTRERLLVTRNWMAKQIQGVLPTGTLFSSLPLPVQVALLDMIFGLGPTGLGEYRKMLRHIGNRAWAAAGMESGRKANGKPLVSRNAATLELFRMAAELDPT